MVDRLNPKRPNKAPEPTSTSVMPRAIVCFFEMKPRKQFPNQARVTPAVAVAHLERWAKPMIPIYEQGISKGIGHSFDSFLNRFDALCREHLRENRARAFAFIFYDFGDQKFRSILKSQGVFAQLDRLAGSDLSVFYLHSARRRTVERFNESFIEKLGISAEVRLPCIVFFRVKNDEVTDVAVAQLESGDLVHGFHELYVLIERYIKEELSGDMEGSRYVRWLKSGSKFIGLEALKVALKVAFERLW
jgi:hypothetical protein